MNDVNDVTAQDVLALANRVRNITSPQDAQATMQELVAVHAYLSERYCHYHAERRIAVAREMARLREMVDEKGRAKYTMGDAEAISLVAAEDVYRAEYRFRGLLDAVNEAIQVLKMRGRLYMAEMANIRAE